MMIGLYNYSPYNYVMKDKTDRRKKHLETCANNRRKRKHKNK